MIKRKIYSNTRTTQKFNARSFPLPWKREWLFNPMKAWPLTLNWQLKNDPIHDFLKGFKLSPRTKEIIIFKHSLLRSKRPDNVQKQCLSNWTSTKIIKGANLPTIWNRESNVISTLWIRLPVGYFSTSVTFIKCYSTFIKICIISSKAQHWLNYWQWIFFWNSKKDFSGIIC